MTARTPADLAAIEANVDLHGVMPTVLALMDRAETAEAEVKRLGGLLAHDGERLIQSQVACDALRARLAKVEALAAKHGSGHPEYPTISALELRRSLTDEAVGPSVDAMRGNPTPCPAALNIKGEHFPCQQMDHMREGSSDHNGWAHSNRDAEAIWTDEGAGE